MVVVIRRRGPRVRRTQSCSSVGLRVNMYVMVDRTLPQFVPVPFPLLGTQASGPVLVVGLHGRGMSALLLAGELTRPESQAIN